MEAMEFFQKLRNWCKYDEGYYDTDKCNLCYMRRICLSSPALLKDEYYQQAIQALNKPATTLAAEKTAEMKTFYEKQEAYYKKTIDDLISITDKQDKKIRRKSAIIATLCIIVLAYCLFRFFI